MWLVIYLGWAALFMYLMAPGPYYESRKQRDRHRRVLVYGGISLVVLTLLSNLLS